MRATIMLSDLVLLQMEGYLEKAMELLRTKNEILPVIEEAKSKSTNPLLYRSIVNKSILNQFGDKHITLRELGQNAKDAYTADDAERNVEFSSSEEGDDFLISVRDYGRGMTPESLIKDLLIPYNSSKYLDADTIGEHGIGWYSVMDLAEKVEVVTSKEGKLSKAVVYKSGEDWYADIEVSEGFQKGTIVNAHVKNEITSTKLINQNLLKHLGYVDSEKALITFNGEKINTMDEEYPYSVSVVLNYKGRRDSIKMLYKKGEDKKKTILVTQDGLFIGNFENPFTKKSLYYDFLNMCLESSLDIWVDLPKNIGLTKGRKEVVKKDQAIYYTALRRCFEILLLAKILPDEELARKIDNELAYIAKNIFFESYDLSSNIYFRNNQPFDFETMAEDDKKEDNLSPFKGLLLKNDDKEMMFVKRAKKYFNEVTHLCHDFFSLRFIPAIKVLEGSSEFVKISANDMIKLFYNNLLGEADMDDPPQADGIYYNRDSKFCYALTHQIYIVKVTEQGKEPATKSKTLIDDKTEIKAVSFKTFKEKLQIQNRGGEYIAFFETLSCMDELLFLADDIPKSEFYFLINQKEDIICPSENGLGINFFHKNALDIVDVIRKKESDKEFLFKLLDLYLYAKTYAVSKKFYISSDEVEEFYELTKKEIRDVLVRYLFENNISLDKKILEILSKVSAAPILTPDELSACLKS